MLPARIEQKIARMPDGCWYWTASRNTYGYGQINIGGRPVGAHRAVWQMLRGTIPKKHDLHHRCPNRSCVNPEHLQLVTRKQHVQLEPGSNANKSHCMWGHEYTEANTYRNPRGIRQCRTCINARNRAAYRRKRGQ